MKLLIDNTPLTTGHAVRGIGTYTRELTVALAQMPEMDVVCASYLNERIAEYDLIHFPYFDLFFKTLPRLSKPFVVTIHDVIPLEFPDAYKPGIKGKIAFIKQKRRLRSAKAVLTDSLASKASISHFLPIAQNKIFSVPLGVKSGLTPADKALVESVLDNYGINGKYVLYVGDINFNKNLPEFIKAFRHLPETLELVLVGANFVPSPIPEWAAIERQIAAVNCISRTHFITDIPPSDISTLSAIYSGALCYVQPSLAEGFGLPILEAQACGTPVVASARSSLLEIGGRSCMYVPPDSESFANAIRTILDWDTVQRKDVIQEGIANAQSYTWKLTAERTATIYKSVLL